MKSSSFYKILIFLSWFIALLLFFNSPLNLNKDHMTITLLNVLICSFLFFSYQKYIHKKLILVSITSLFLISIFITHFQIGLSHILGFEIDNKTFLSYIWGDTNKGNLSLTISSLGLISFYLGHVFNKKKRIPKIVKKYNINRYGALIDFLTFCSIIFYILFFITSGSYKYGNYASGDQLLISNYFQNFFRIFIKTALILKMYSLNSESNIFNNIREYILYVGKPLTAIVLWHILFSAFVGDRAPIISFCILYFGLFIIRGMNKKVRLTLIVSAIAFPVIFSVLGASRSRSSSDSFISKVSSSDYESRYSSNFSQENIPGLSTLELALSVRSLNHAISNVPSNYDYKYGVFQLKQVLASVPFLNGFLDSYFVNSKKENDSSADFISFLIQGKNPKYGDATTPVADLYLDFGVLGVVIGFFIFGIWARKADLTIIYGSDTSMINWIAIMFFWSGSIYLGRATFLYYLQTIIQIYLVFVFFNSIFKYTKGSFMQTKTNIFPNLDKK